MPRAKLIALGLVLAAGCSAGSEPVGDQARLEDKTFTLALGESLTVGHVVVRFAAVESDSRCRPEVVCVWAGNARLAVSECPASGYGPCHEVIFNTLLEPRVSGDGLIPLRLVALEPEYRSLDPTAYRATFTLAAGPD